MNAYLPHMARIAIKDLRVGEQAYTAPWSLQVDQNGRCWIRGDYPFTPEPFGAHQMLVKRTDNGFEVQVPHNAQYEQAYISYEAALQMSLLPVVKMN